MIILFSNSMCSSGFFAHHSALYWVCVRYRSCGSTGHDGVGSTRRGLGSGLIMNGGSKTKVILGVLCGATPLFM